MEALAMRPAKHALLSASLALACPEPVLAGMPSPTAILNDLARMRVQSLSFFIVGFLVSAAVIQRLWNLLQRDFVSMPRLGYRAALGVVTLWGLLFILVLTMISGARELLTPGAWEPNGKTYKLASSSPSTPNAPTISAEDARRHKLEDLRDVLWDYAQAHGGKFPSDQSDPWIPRERWQTTDSSEMLYLYVGGQAAGQGMRVLVYEPGLFGRDRLVLLANGAIKSMKAEQVAQALTKQKP
jgi:hypothetical protein